MPILSHTDLEQLGLFREDIQAVSREEQPRFLRNKFIELSLKHHPDKDPNNPRAGENFNNIKNAYERLKDQMAGDEEKIWQDDIMQYYAVAEMDIPSTAFDGQALDDIERTHEALRTEFRFLESEEEKTAFGQYYGPFLNLAQTLAARQEELIRERVACLYAHESETSFVKGFVQDWREMMLRLFGEEFLDDFQYREALATGNLYPVLATRKLLSPVKGVVAIINSAILFLTDGLVYLAKQFLKQVNEIFLDGYSQYINGTLSIKKVGALLLSAGALLALTAVPLYFDFLFMPAVFAFSLPMVTAFLNCMASPVNTLIRPLSHWSGLPVPGLSLLAATAAVTSAYAFSGAALLMSLPQLFQNLSLPLVIYSVVANIQLVLNMYELSPALGVLQGVMQAASWLIALLIPTPRIDLSDPVISAGIFFANLTNCSLLYNFNKFIKNPSAKEAELMDVLPLPTEPVPETVRHATFIGNRRAAHSHRFFNTPENAAFVEARERTPRQKFCSFFGGGEVVRRSQTPDRNESYRLRLAAG